MLNIHQLSTFVAVISEGNMTQAADKLYLTQPAVSQQIRQLEEQLGCELLVRGVRLVKPTLQGEILYDYAKKIIQMSHQAEAAIKVLGAKLSGPLKVGTLNSIGLYLMSSTVAKLMKNNPQLNLTVVYENAQELIRLFKKGELDILIIPDLFKEYNCEIPSVSHFLFSEEMWLVHSGKEEDTPNSIKASEIAKNSHVLFSGEYDHFDKVLKPHISNKSSINFTSSNVGTLKRVIESGLGWGFLPSHSIRKQVRSGRLQRIMIEDFKYEFEIKFYHSENTQKKLLVDAFFQALKGQEKS